MADNITVGILRALLTADTAQFEDGMRKGSAAVKQFGTDTKKQTDVVQDLSDTINKKFAQAFTVTALIGFAKDVGAFAGKMADLSAETSISTTRLQAWNYLVGDAGLSVDDFATAVQQLQKRLAGGDASAVSAVTQLGLKVEDLLAMAPDDAFISIAEAAAKVTNHGEQTTLMFDLMGRTGSKALRLVRDDLGETVAKIEHGGGVIDEELIRRADQFDEAWDHAFMRFRAGMVTIVGAVGDKNIGLLPGGIDLPMTMPNAPNAPGMFGANGGPSAVQGPSKEYLAALDEQAKKIKENVAAYEAHQRALADLASELSGQKAIKEAQDLQAAFLSLTPAERDNQQTVQAVFDQYVKLEQRIGLGVVPVLDQLYQSKGLVTERSRAMAQQLMLTTGGVEALQSATEALIPPVLETNDALDMTTQQMVGVTYTMGAGTKTIHVTREAVVSAWTEIDTLARSFEQLANIAGDSFGAVTRSIGTFVGALSTAHTAWGTLTKGFKDFTGGGLSGILGGLGSMVSGVGAIASAAMAAFQGVQALVGAFKSDETKFVNKPRDQFFGQFGNDKDSQYQNLAAALTEAAGSGDIANQLITSLYDADNASKFKSAEQAIVDVFAAAGKNIQMFAEGGIAMGPTLGVFGEKGPEAVIPLNRMNSVLGGSGTAALEAKFDALIENMRRRDRDLPNAIAVAVQAAVALAPRMA